MENITSKIIFNLTCIIMQKALKSGLYFQKVDILANGTFLTIMVVLSARFCSWATRESYFSFPRFIEIFMYVEHHLEK